MLLYSTLWSMHSTLRVGYSPTEQSCKAIHSWLTMPWHVCTLEYDTPTMLLNSLGGGARLSAMGGLDTPKVPCFPAVAGGLYHTLEYSRTG